MLRAWLDDVLALCEDRAFIALDVGKGEAGQFGNFGGRGTAADPGLDVAGRHGNGRVGGARRHLGRGAARRGPEGFVDRKLEHRTARAAQEQMPAVVVDAYQS